MNILKHLTDVSMQNLVSERPMLVWGMICMFIGLLAFVILLALPIMPISEPVTVDEVVEHLSKRADIGEYTVSGEKPVVKLEPDEVTPDLFDNDLPGTIVYSKKPIKKIWYGDAKFYYLPNIPDGIIREGHDEPKLGVLLEAKRIFPGRGKSVSDSLVEYAILIDANYIWLIDIDTIWRKQ